MLDGLLLSTYHHIYVKKTEGLLARERSSFRSNEESKIRTLREMRHISIRLSILLAREFRPYVPIREKAEHQFLPVHLKLRLEYFHVEAVFNDFLLANSFGFGPIAFPL